jgi:UTP:GlnB (protein PII) uridylyltransferase
METRVRFVGEQQGVLSLLEIETEGRGGLLRELSRVLFDLRVQLVRVESQATDEGRRHERLWLVEFDGAPIGRARRLEIQIEVLRAVELGRGAPVQPDQPFGMLEHSRTARVANLTS